MHKIGLKLWNINTDYYYDEAKKLYQEGVFDYIELYVVPGNLDKIDKWKKIEIPFDVHAPHFAFHVNLSKTECYEYNKKCYLETKKYADELNADIIVFHGGINGDYKETARQLKSFNDKRILIENKPMVPLKVADARFCVGAKIDEIKYIMEEANCGFCLDIGHAICAANAQKIDPYEYIEDFAKLNPKRIHLSDIHIDSIYDEHLHYGSGNVDFKKMLSIIPRDVCITIETVKELKENLNDFENDIEELKNFIN